MAKFTLTIETNDAAELADITAAIADEQAAAHTQEQTSISDNPEPKADVARPTPPKRGRPAKTTAAKDAAPTEEVPAEEQASASTPSTTVSHFDMAAAAAEKDVAKIDVEGAGLEPISAADCKLALNAAMDRKHDPASIQKALLEKFGGGSISRIDEARYGDVKAYLDSLK